MDVLERIEKQVNNLVEMVGGQTSKIEKVHVDFSDLVDLALLAQQGKRIQWVSVADQLPENEQVVDIIVDDGDGFCYRVTDVGYDSENECFDNQYYVPVDGEEVFEAIAVYWMPVPSMPKGVE